jgi:hypothetical protein
MRAPFAASVREERRGTMYIVRVGSGRDEMRKTMYIVEVEAGESKGVRTRM